LFIMITHWVVWFIMITQWVWLDLSKQKKNRKNGQKKKKSTKKKHGGCLCDCLVGIWIAILDLFNPKQSLSKSKFHNLFLKKNNTKLILFFFFFSFSFRYLGKVRNEFNPMY